MREQVAYCTQRGGVTMTKDEKTTRVILGALVLSVIFWLSWRTTPRGDDRPPPRGSWTTGPDVRNGVVQENFGLIPRGSWTTGPDVRNGVVQ
jgi:hypothetical protein